MTRSPLSRCLLLGLALALSPAAQAGNAAKARAAFDLMDRQDFLDGIEAAGQCVQRNDFACAEKTLAGIKEMASSPEQDQLWAAASRELQGARQRVAQQQAQEQARAEQARLAQQRQQQSQQQSGYQWGKLAALAAGAAIGGLDQLDSQTQADVVMGMVKDSMGGQQGISGMQGAVAEAQQRLGGGSGSGGGAAAGRGGSAGTWTPEPNTLLGDPACPGYSNTNYMQYYESHKHEDGQLHPLCAAAFNYYSMYLNARTQGYSKQEAQQTYEAFRKSAQVATEYYRQARAR